MERDDVSFLRMQAEHHPLEYTGTFRSQTEYRLHLMHRKSYEDAMALATGLSALDLGCNNGWGTQLLAGAAKEVIGVDVSSTAVADARRQFSDIDFQLYDGRTLPFTNGRFDIVVSLQVIEHIADLNVYLAEIARVLVHGGRAVFTTPNAAVRLDPGMPPWNEFHVREFSADDLRSALRPYFSTVTITGMFATEVLYRTELQRLDEVKAAARAAARRTAGSRRTVREQTKAALKALLPNAGLELLRKIRRLKAAKQSGDASLQRYSTSDFFYRGEQLDRALDLMAVCEGPLKV